jgi:signal transduction histidine kinase
LLAIGLSGVATGFILLPGRLTGHPEIVGAFAVRLIVFTIVALLANALHVATRRAAVEAQKAREAAESANEAKSRFLAMVSHELRTPLSPVLMAAEMLEQDVSLPDRVRKDLGTIRRNVELERRLIDDLVDLTRITSGKMSLHITEIDLHEPLRQAIGVCDADARDKQIDLGWQLDARASRVNGDADRLQQVFWNLLRNAIKFTPAGGRIRITTENSGAGRIAVTFADTGTGIDPARLQSIFEAFEQGGPDVHSRFGGLGLGLAICHALVESHGGTVAAASEGAGRGAAFTVILPLTPTGPSRSFHSGDDFVR